jgi:hypothetical protein
LYFEVRNNQNTSTTAGYDFPPRNRLLHFLFGNAKNAERLYVWSPVAEYLLFGPASPDLEENRTLLNRPMRDFQENGQWTSPFAIGIRFFDLMVTAALVQNIQWHMWLWYFNHFTERLVDALDPHTSGMDEDAEWPTIGYFLIYEMFSAMANWIRLVEYLPPDQANVVLQNTRFAHENGNIPKSAILVMALCFRKVILSENVIPRFKRYLRDILLGLLKDINGRKSLAEWSEMLVNALAAGDFGQTRIRAEYQIAMKGLLAAADLSVMREAEMLIGAIERDRVAGQHRP